MVEGYCKLMPDKTYFNPYVTAIITYYHINLYIFLFMIINALRALIPQDSRYSDRVNKSSAVRLRSNLSKECEYVRTPHKRQNTLL